jgi:hypothetical protein
MVSRVDFSSNSPISAVSSVGATDNVANPHQESNLRLDQIAIGQALRGQVVSSQADGSSLVKLQLGNQDSQLVKLQLPAGFLVGDELALTLLSKGGDRASFALGLMVTQDTVNVSHAGQLLEQLTHSNQQSQPKVTGTTPLLTSSNSGNPSQLANELSKTLENSGVFYEAHLRQWHDGERNLEQVRQEPQNLLSPSPDGINNWMPAQLDSLENQRFVWQGELWPGQPIEWEVDKQPESSSPSPSDENNPVWQTTVKLELPNLGQIKATIRLQGEHAQLMMNVADATTASQLKAASDQLALALEASGNALDSVTVSV